LDLKDKENRNVLLQEEIGTLQCNYNLLTDYTKSVEADSWRLEQLETGGISVEQQIEDKENRNVLLQEEIGTLRCNYNLLTESTKSVRADSLRLKQLETGGISVEQQFKSWDCALKDKEDRNVLLQKEIWTLRCNYSLLTDYTKSVEADSLRLEQLETGGISVEQQIESLNLDLKDKENRNVLLQEEIGTLQCNYNLLTDYTKSVEADSWRLEQLETGGISVEQQIEDKENRNVLLQEEIGTLRCNYNLLTESTKSVRADSLRLKQLETGGISVEQQFKRHTEDKNLLKETILKLENRQAGLMTANQSCSEQSYKSKIQHLTGQLESREKSSLNFQEEKLVAANTMLNERPLKTRLLTSLNAMAEKRNAAEKEVENLIESKRAATLGQERMDMEHDRQRQVGKFQQVRVLKGFRRKKKRGEIHGSSTMVVDQGEKDCINPCKKKSGVAETKAFYDDEFGARNIEQCKSRQMKRSETTFEFSADQFSPRPKRRRNRIFFYD